VKNEVVFPHFDWNFSFRLFKNRGSGLEVLWADPECLLLLGGGVNEPKTKEKIRDLAEALAV